MLESYINFSKDIMRIKHNYFCNMFNFYTNYLRLFCRNDLDKFYYDYHYRLDKFFKSKKSN